MSPPSGEVQGTVQKGKKEAGFLSLSGRQWFLLFFFLLAVDALSKYVIQHYLPVRGYDHLWYPYGGIGIFRNILGVEFSIVHATNKGAAWGMLSGYQVPLLYFRMALVAAISFYLFLFKTRQAFRLPFALILAGAIGNIFDYFLYGHVVDMFRFILWGYDYPVFNIADSSIFVGLAILLIEETRRG